MFGCSPSTTSQSAFPSQLATESPGPGASLTSAPPSSNSAAPRAVVHVDIRVPIASSANVGGPCDAGSFGSHTYADTLLSTIPGAKFTFGVLRGPVLAEKTVPTTGTIVASGRDDPVFRTTCSFTFDVPLDATAPAYVFSVGQIYLPVPIMSHDQLAATGWTATIDVNVDQ
jgi:hypothetical protein